MTNIYALLDPYTNEVRYIGKTKYSLTHRLSGHLQSKQNNHRCNWIASIVKQGKLPNIILIEQTYHWEEAEIFWISYFKFLGARLVNSTSGGEGSCFTGESLGNIRRILTVRNKSDKQRNAVSIKLKNRVISEQQRKDISKALTGNKATEETKAKLSLKQIQINLEKPDVKQARLFGLDKARRRPCSEEKKKRLSESQKGNSPPNKGKPMLEEQKIKLSLAKKGKPGHKHTEEYKQYMSNVLKGRTFTDEHKQKLSKARKGKPLTEEHKQKIKESWQRRKNDRLLSEN